MREFRPKIMDKMTLTYCRHYSFVTSTNTATSMRQKRQRQTTTWKRHQTKTSSIIFFHQKNSFKWRRSFTWKYSPLKFCYCIWNSEITQLQAVAYLRTMKERIQNRSKTASRPRSTGFLNHLNTPKKPIFIKNKTKLNFEQSAEKDFFRFIQFSTHLIRSESKEKRAEIYR